MSEPVSPGLRCQIGDCRQNAVARDGGVNVCEGHMGWKRGKAQPTVGGIPAEEWKRRYDAIMERVNAHEAAEQPADAQVSDAARLRVAHSLLRHRDALKGGGPHITQLRHDLQTAATMLAPLMVMRVPPDGPFPLSEPRLSWEAAIARDLARREGSTVPPAPAQPPALDPATHAHVVSALGECIERVEAMDVRTYPIDVVGLLVAARAARVALGMQLPPAPAVPLRVWSCKIGEIEGSALPDGADSPLRQAVAEAYRTLTGRDPVFLFSGWGGSLDAHERAAVNSEPTSPSI